MSELIKEIMTEIGHPYEINEKGNIVICGFTKSEYSPNMVTDLCEIHGLIKEDGIKELKKIMNIEVNTEKEKIFIQELKEKTTYTETLKAKKNPVLKTLDKYVEDINECPIYTSINVVTLIQTSLNFTFEPEETYNLGCLRKVGYYQINDKKFPVFVWTLECQEEYFIVNNNFIKFKGQFKEFSIKFWEYFKIKFIISKVGWYLFGKRNFRKRIEKSKTA